MNPARIQPPATIAPPASASMTAAEATRTPRSERPGAICTVVETVAPSGSLPSAIAPLAPGEGGQGSLEMRRREIGPQHVGEPQLGIGGLPQQEVRQPQLARGADQQV